MCLRQVSLRSRCIPRYFTSSAWGRCSLFNLTGGTWCRHTRGLSYFIHEVERQRVGIVPSFVPQSLPVLIVCTVSSPVSHTVYYSTSTQDFNRGQWQWSDVILTKNDFDFSVLYTLSTAFDCSLVTWLGITCKKFSSPLAPSSISAQYGTSCRCAATKQPAAPPPTVMKLSCLGCVISINPLKPELNPICYLLALLGAHHFLHVSRIRVKLLTFRRLMPYIYGAPILDVSRSHTTTQHSR